MSEIHPSPKAFLKARRPERFSDSFVEVGPRLDRATVEYHLATLTSRSQETVFQDFARHLLQLEVCPNLLSQTGPTGGGDSKVDSETYPVSEDLSLVWCVGKGTEAASDRWAFAFSAKKVWREKVQSDIAKIAATGRDYKKAFFVTNQYVSDKKRSEVEDALSKKHGLDVRIFDLTWILDRIFEGGHEALVIEDLKLQYKLRTTVRQGPLDAHRQSELEALERRIESTAQHGTQSRHLVDDCIEAVILARSLDRPRTEMDGLLARAARVAAKYGSAHQRLVSAYQHAWTAFWHFEDFSEFVRQYAEVESLAKGSALIYHAELLTNTWFLLTIVFQQSQIEEQELDAHTSVLIVELDRYASDDSRPSASLQARCMRLIVELIRTKAAEPDSIFLELKDVIERSEHLIGFPLASFVDTLTQFGAGFGDNRAFDDLVQTIEIVWARRKGDLAAARLQLSRGAQQLDANRPLQAIRTLGRALTRLFKHESKDELVHALYLCSSAYERIGLLWAARGSAVTAASLAIDEFWKYQDVTRLQSGCCNRLKWIELQLGRISQALCWHEVDCIVRFALRNKGEGTSVLDDGDLSFDAILGIQFLRLDFWLLKDVRKLPATLEACNLNAASLALRFALGDETSVAADLELAGTGDTNLQKFFLRWRDQPARDELRNEPQLGHQQNVRLQTKVAGCEINVKCQNEQSCVAVAESFLASLESLLATGLADRVFARQPSLHVGVTRSDFGEVPFTHDMTEKDGVLEFRIQCSSFDSNQMSLSQQLAAKRRLLELVTSVIFNSFYIGDAKSFIENIFGDEQAVDRAVHFTSSFVVLGNVLGNSPRNSITEWIQEDAPDISLSRSTRWDDSCELNIGHADEEHQPVEFGSGRPADGFPNPERIKHSQMHSVSLIRDPLWNRAGWAGIAFVVFDEPQSAPLLLPVFRDAAVARAIFEGLREDVGEADKEDRLRVTLVRGISRSNPHAYRVIFGTQLPKEMKSSQWRMVAIGARVHTMEPSSNQNIDMFMNRYAKVEAYGIAPCVLDSNDQIEEPMFEVHIKKWHLNVRNAWQIGLNDLDSVGVLPGDDPIIPDTELNPPVTELLKRKKSRASP